MNDIHKVPHNLGNQRHYDTAIHLPDWSSGLNGSAQTADARRSRLAALQTALDHRAHDRLAGQLPAAGCALRPLADHLSWVLSYRLLHDHLTEGFEIASNPFGHYC